MAGSDPDGDEKVRTFFAPLAFSRNSIVRVPVPLSLPVAGKAILVAIPPFTRSSANLGDLSGLL